MPLHLLKLCVGVATVAELENRVRAGHGEGRSQPMTVTTRMMPKRAIEILNGGSLYWVIKGQLAARQRVMGISPFVGPDGIGRCHLDLAPALVPVLPQPCRAFQGWRYLANDDRPADLSNVAEALEMPEALLRSLRDLCLI